MNFGNPEKEEIMGQFAGVINGMIEACEILDYPSFQEMYLYIMKQMEKELIPLQ
ncbi:MAG: hypothetical protein CM15mP109_14290 [Candidatus Dadabacteria bacterium]|nr:MAG: hypothetical protein CM15mP109_14290 [Candidatus Dadabacteria bacterium]